jgi:hypothetical protein
LSVDAGLKMMGDAAAVLSVDAGLKMMGDAAAVLSVDAGLKMMGDAAAVLSVDAGLRMMGELAANPLCAGKECVVGAAAAVIADRATAEPKATHETFNHDEDILVHLNVYKEF